MAYRRQNVAVNLDFSAVRMQMEASLPPQPITPPPIITVETVKDKIAAGRALPFGAKAHGGSSVASDEVLQFRILIPDILDGQAPIKVRNVEEFQKRYHKKPYLDKLISGDAPQALLRWMRAERISTLEELQKSAPRDKRRRWLLDLKKRAEQHPVDEETLANTMGHVAALVMNNPKCVRRKDDQKWIIRAFGGYTFGDALDTFNYYVKNPEVRLHGIAQLVAGLSLNPYATAAVMQVVADTVNENYENTNIAAAALPIGQRIIEKAPDYEVADMGATIITAVAGIARDKQQDALWQAAVDAMGSALRGTKNNISNKLEQDDVVKELLAGGVQSGLRSSFSSAPSQRLGRFVSTDVDFKTLIDALDASIEGISQAETEQNKERRYRRHLVEDVSFAAAALTVEQQAFVVDMIMGRTLHLDEEITSYITPRNEKDKTVPLNSYMPACRPLSDKGKAILLGKVGKDSRLLQPGQVAFHLRALRSLMPRVRGKITAAEENLRDTIFEAAKGIATAPRRVGQSLESINHTRYVLENYPDLISSTDGLRYQQGSECVVSPGPKKGRISDKVAAEVRRGSGMGA